MREAPTIMSEQIDTPKTSQEALNVPKTVLTSSLSDHNQGKISLCFETLSALTPHLQAHIIARCVVVAGGGGRIARRSQIERLISQLHKNETLMTLAGALIRRQGAIIEVAPETDSRRTQLKTQQKMRDQYRFYHWRLKVSLGFVKNEAQHDDLLRET
jgi:hypothetical protein